MNKIGISTLLALSALVVACGDKKEPVPAATPVSTQNAPTEAPVVKEAKTNEELYNLALGFEGFVAGGESKGMMANPEVVVFFDPQCPHCGTYWNGTRILKDVKMKWVPVAILNQKSMVDASHILASQNPVETMTLHERLLDENKGGLQETKIVEAFKDKITSNTDFFAVNMKGVPFTVYRTANGEYGTFTGAVPVSELMKALGITSVELNTTDNAGGIEVKLEEPAPAEGVAPATEVTAPAEGVAPGTEVTAPVEGSTPTEATVPAESTAPATTETIPAAVTTNTVTEAVVSTQEGSIADAAVTTESVVNEVKSAVVEIKEATKTAIEEKPETK